MFEKRQQGDSALLMERQTVVALTCWACFVLCLVSLSSSGNNSNNEETHPINSHIKYHTFNCQDVKIKALVNVVYYLNLHVNSMTREHANY